MPVQPYVLVPRPALEAWYDYTVERHAGRVSVRDFSQVVAADDITHLTGAGTLWTASTKHAIKIVAVALAIWALSGFGGFVADRGSGGVATVFPASLGDVSIFAASKALFDGAAPAPVNGRVGAVRGDVAGSVRAVANCRGHAPSNPDAAANDADLSDVHGACFTPPAHWTLTRIARGEQSGDPTLAVFANVLVGSACAPLFSPRLECDGDSGGGGGGGGGSATVVPDNETVVLTTHM